MDQFKKHLRLLLVLFLAMACPPATLHAHGEPPQPPLVQPLDEYVRDANPNPIGTDPLSQAEFHLAQESATKHIRQLRPPTRIQRNLFLPDIQFLCAQRYDQAKGETALRHADVYFYNYASDEVIRQIVNVRTGQVDDVRVFAGARQQPRVVQAEVNAAIDLLWAHPKLGTALRQYYKTQTAARARGVLYFSDSPHSKLFGVAAVCQLQRCIQLLLPFDEQHFIDAGNLVVNLSSGQLYWVDEGLRVFVDDHEIRAPLALVPAVWR